MKRLGKRSSSCVRKLIRNAAGPTFSLLSVVALHGEEPLSVADLKRESPVDFNAEIIPIFKRNCLACHNETKAKAKLILETPEHIRKGGDSGPAVEARNAEVSLLFTTSAHLEDPVMPPPKNKSKAKNLTPDELALLKLWIDQGAKGTANIAAAAPKTWQRVANHQPIYTITISDDGRYAACGRGHTIYVYDLRLQKLVTTLADPNLEGGISHRDFVHSLTFGPDGTLASGGFRVVKLWTLPDVLPISETMDVPKKKEPISWADQKLKHGESEIEGAAAITSAVVVNGGNMAAASLADSRIQLVTFDSTDASPVILAGHTKPPKFLIPLGEDQIQLLSAGADGTIRVWDLAGKNQLRQISFGNPITQIAISPDETKVLAMGATGPARLINLADGKTIKDLELAPELSSQIAGITLAEAQAKRLSALYTASVPKLEEAWKKEGEAADKAGQEIPKARQAYAEKQTDLAVKKRAFQLAAHEWKRKQKSEDAKVVEAAQKVYEHAQEALESVEADSANANRAISMAIRNRDLAAKLTGDAAGKLAEAKSKKATADATMETLKTQRETLQKKLAEEVPNLTLGGVSFGKNGSIVTALTDGLVHIFAVDGNHLKSLQTGAKIAAVSIDSEGRIVTKSEDGRYRTWNSNGTWKLSKKLGDGEDPALLIDRVTALAFDDSGSTLVTGSGVPSRSGRLKIWDIESGTVIVENGEAHSDTITEIAFSPTGEHIVTGSTDQFVKTFDTETAEHIKSFEAHTGHVLGVDWSHDGRLLVSGGADKEVKLWDVETGEQIKTLKGWKKEVTSVAFLTRATEQILTTSGDASIKLDTTAISGSSGFLYNSVVSKDGSLIVAGGQDGVLRVWTAKDRNLVMSFDSPEDSTAGDET